MPQEGAKKPEPTNKPPPHLTGEPTAEPRPCFHRGPSRTTDMSPLGADCKGTSSPAPQGEATMPNPPCFQQQGLRPLSHLAAQTHSVSSFAPMACLSHHLLTDPSLRNNSDGSRSESDGPWSLEAETAIRCPRVLSSLRGSAARGRAGEARTPRKGGCVAQTSKCPLRTLTYTGSLDQAPAVLCPFQASHSLLAQPGWHPDSAHRARGLHGDSCGNDTCSRAMPKVLENAG